MASLVVDFDFAGAATSLTVMSKVASLPARFAAGYSAGKVTVMLFSSPALTPTSWSSKPGMKRSGTEDQRCVVIGAAVEGFAIDLAEVVHGDAVAVGGLALLRFVGAGAFGDLEDLLVDFVFVDTRRLRGSPDAVDVLELDRRDELRK